MSKRVKDKLRRIFSPCIPRPDSPPNAETSLSHTQPQETQDGKHSALKAPLSQDPSDDEQSVSKVAGYLSLAYGGLKLFLHQVEPFLEGTMFQAPVAVINSLIDLSEAIADNNSSIKGLMVQLTDRIKAMSEACQDAESDEAKKRIDDFIRVLVRYSAEVQKLRTDPSWKKVLINEEVTKKIQDIVEEMNQALAMFQIKVVLSIERDIGKMKDALDGIRLESWPRIDTARYNVSRSRSACTPDTRINILHRIRDWALDSSSNGAPVYWLSGMGGTGKSTIAYTIANMFDDPKQQEYPRILAATYFCSRQDGQLRDVFNIIPTISHQLAGHVRSYADILLHSTDVSVATIADLQRQIRELLVQPWQESAEKRAKVSPNYLIVIDALDEIDNGKGSQFLQGLMDTAADGHLQGLKFLVTSRPHPQIVKVVEGGRSQDAIFRLEEVSTHEMEEDIGKFLRKELGDLNNNQIQDIVTRSNGLFIFAATVVRSINGPGDRSRRERQKAFEHLLRDWPAGEGLDIDSLYQQILMSALSKHSADERNYRLAILHIILCAAEPLSPSAIAGLCDLDLETIQMLLDSLHAALYIPRYDNRIYWYHLTFQDFFFDEKRSLDIKVSGSAESLNVFCDQSLVHSSLANHCLHTMKEHLRFNICDLPSSFLYDSEVDGLDDRIKERVNDVLSYSTRYWGHHLAKAQSKDSENRLLESLVEFLDNKLLFWIEVMNLIGSKGRCIPQLRDAVGWLQKYQKNDPGRISYLIDAQQFVTVFCGTEMYKSTPHLYISCLTTRPTSSPVSKLWRPRFTKLPSIRIRGNLHNLLMVKRADSPANSVAFSPDGERIIAGLHDMTIRIWDTTSGEQLKCLSGHEALIASVAFSPDGSLIVSLADDSTIRVWDATNGKELRTFAREMDSFTSIAFLRDSSRIISWSGDGMVRVWDVKSGELSVEELKSLPAGHIPTTRYAFSPDRSQIVCGSWDDSESANVVRVLDATSGRELKTLRGHTNRVASVAFSPAPDDPRIISGSDDKTIRVWDAITGKQLKVLYGDVASVAFSPDGSRIVSGSGTVQVWDAMSGERLKSLPGHAYEVLSVAFSPDGSRVISGSYDGTVRVWDAVGGVEESVESLAGHTSWVTSVGFESPDGSHVVSGSLDGTIRVWDATNGKELKTLEVGGYGVTSMALSPDGSRIISQSSDKTIQVWDGTSGVALKTLAGSMHSTLSVAFLPDGVCAIAGVSDDMMSIQVWDAMSGELKSLGGRDSYAFTSIALSPDGSHIASGSDGDKMVRVWDVSTGEEVTLAGHTEGVTSVAFSPDGSRVISGSIDQTVRIWDAKTWKELKGPAAGSAAALAGELTFSPGHSEHIAFGWDDEVRVLDGKSWEELTILRGHTSSVTSVAFSPDGSRIVSGSRDKTVRVWDTVVLRGQELDQWFLKDDGWIVNGDHAEDRLMVVPFPRTLVFDPRTTQVLISQEGSVSVDFSGCTLGPGWEACYTPRYLHAGLKV